MAFKFITIPIRDPEAHEAELNKFLASHKVLSIDRRWVEQGSESFWSICVDYHASNSTSSSTARFNAKKPPVDYQEILSPEDFKVFSELREVRKEVAQSEGVAVYLIFTNEQLAKMAEKRATTKSDLEKIFGVGNSRVEKYGEAFEEATSKRLGSEDETSKKPR